MAAGDLYVQVRGSGGGGLSHPGVLVPVGLGWLLQIWGGGGACPSPGGSAPRLTTGAVAWVSP